MNFLRNDNRIIDIPIQLIKSSKNQPRRFFDENELKALAYSIKQNGILQPLSVRRIDNNEFELIAGERRLRACIMLGLKKVPCIIMNCSCHRATVLSLIENLQRTDLNPFEEALGIKRLISEFGITQEQAAMRLGKKQSTIANKLRLLKFTNEEQLWIIRSDLTERHARTLLRIEEPELRKEVLSKVINQKLNVSQTELLVNKVLNTVTDCKKDKKFIVKDVRIFVNTINKAIDVMKSSGINAKAIKKETDEFIEYNVRIPKDEALKTNIA